MVADAVALVSYRRARAKRDGRTPSYGHGKAEPLGALGVSLVLLGAGAGAAWHSVSLLLPPLGAAVAEAGAHSHSTALMTLEDPVFATAALAIAAGSVVAKELLFRWTLRVGEAQKSQVLIANAWHHRADSWSGLVALVGVAGANCGVLWLDPACGLVVSGLIVKASIDMIKPALSELLDEVDTEVVEQVKHILHSVAKSDKNIVAFHTIRARKMGPETFVDFQVQVNPRITVSLAHQISENARHAIVSALPAVAEVLVHVDVDPPAHNAASPAATEHPTSHIERQIMDSVLPDLIPLGVDRFAHFKVHYLNGGMEIEAEIILSDCSDKMLFKDAVKLAHAVRERLLEYPGVVAADVHLETDDRHSA
ncbi:hypothetical protein HDU83_001436 [Entophlyctis luteolus]|nr:hypothetical protein HDU83_001436 [Entophlyctis luteolus]